MGLLDQVIGSVTGGKDGHASPLTKALLMMLAAKAASSYFGGDAKAAGTAAGGAPAEAPAAPSGKVESGILAGIPSLDSLLGRTPAPETPAAPGSRIDSGILAGFPSLDSILGSLRTGGHEDKVESWIGKGENHDLPPQALGGAIGQQALGQLAQATGMSKDDLLKALSGVLPQVIDKLTPDGKLPDAKDRGHW